MVKENELLIDEVRNIKTIAESIPIYENAKIELSKFHPEEVSPIAKYVLLPNLKRILYLNLYLKNLNKNMFELDEVVPIGDQIIGPPIVEWSEQDGVPVIVDGIHRFWLARLLDVKVNSIYVKNVDPNYPVTSYPVNWDEVIVRKEWPEDINVRRDLRVDQNLTNKFYRDFSILGSTGRRTK
jgi:hypothetical protein